MITIDNTLYPNFKFVKEIVSDTKTRAIHVKFNNNNYRVTVFPYRKEGFNFAAYESNRNGKPNDVQKWLFNEKAYKSTITNKACDEDILQGLEKLNEYLTKSSTKM